MGSSCPFNTIKTQHQFKMRAFIVLACVGVAFAGEDMFGMKKMQKTWAEHKAMESCFGENMMKTSLLKMKKAVVKCTGMDMPELDLPMYNNPHRFVHAFLEGAEDLKTIKMFKAMSALSGNRGFTGVQQSQNAPIQLVLGQQQAPQDNMMKNMFMKMMIKKMFKEENRNVDESPFGNMGSMKYGENDNQDQYKFFQNMMKAMNSRAKRATDDLFELGDRLTNKLKNGKLSSETHPAYSRNSTSLTKTKTSISAAWSNPLNVENGENSQTNGSRNNTSRTAAPAPPSLILSQKLFSKNALGEKSGEES